ncbi:MAG TPA: GNAT family N-acetyltransferase [Candidatus Eremiobacteraceae bacterium]|nr:GNAT family N-acetyltransferase [Candidatus Eremiobacteraceae bacterium]
MIGQATILETYAGIAQGSDLYAYVTKSLGAENFRELLASDRACMWVVETAVGSCAVGYALLVGGEGEEPFAATELERLYVFYRFHGLGLGKRLMDEALAFARAKNATSMTLRVNSLNAHAIAFYERYGFKTESEEPFRAGERDYRVLVMRLRLNSPL